MNSAFTTARTHAQWCSQEFHKWTHAPAPDVPRVARWAQRRGLILTPREHGLHHRAPFDRRYCILTGTCNRLLDDRRVFRRLEHAIYRATGAEPNCWKLSPELREETLRRFG